MFIETICILNGMALNLEAHQQRMKRTATHFGFESPSLQSRLGKEEDIKRLLKGDLQEGKVKCRVVYRDTIEEITVERYHPKKVGSLKLMNASPDYSFKFADRSALNELLKQKGSSDEILIVRDGLITDTSYSNVVFRKGSRLYTPDEPLLNGTKRQQLLHEGRVEEAKITPDRLHEYDRVYLINALLDIEDNVSVPTERVKY